MLQRLARKSTRPCLARVQPSYWVDASAERKWGSPKLAYSALEEGYARVQQMETVRVICKMHVLGAGGGLRDSHLLTVGGANGTFTVSRTGVDYGGKTLASMGDGCHFLDEQFRAEFPSHVCGDGCRDWHSLQSDKGPSGTQ